MGRTERGARKAAGAAAGATIAVRTAGADATDVENEAGTAAATRNAARAARWEPWALAVTIAVVAASVLVSWYLSRHTSRYELGLSLGETRGRYPNGRLNVISVRTKDLASVAAAFTGAPAVLALLAVLRRRFVPEHPLYPSWWSFWAVGLSLGAAVGVLGSFVTDYRTGGVTAWTTVANVWPYVVLLGTVVGALFVIFRWFAAPPSARREPFVEGPRPWEASDLSVTERVALERYRAAAVRWELRAIVVTTVVWAVATVTALLLAERTTREALLWFVGIGGLYTRGLSLAYWIDRGDLAVVAGVAFAVPVAMAVVGRLRRRHVNQAVPFPSIWSAVSVPLAVLLAWSMIGCFLIYNALGKSAWMLVVTLPFSFSAILVPFWAATVVGRPHRDPELRELMQGARRPRLPKRGSRRAGDGTQHG